MALPLFKYRNLAQQWTVGKHLALAQHVARGYPIPIGYWLAVRNLMKGFSRRGGGLTVPSIEQSVAALEVPALEEHLVGAVLGGWALDVETIRSLWSSLETLKPASILEFGSGTSTVVLASHATRQNSGCRIVSLEQNLWAREQTEARLQERSLSHSVEVLYAPVSPDGAYEVSPVSLSSAFAGSRPDWILIDAPFGPPGCRVHTLLRYGSLCAPGARWFLDDAFRDGELQVLRRWRRTPGIRVEGIYPIGKGLATGTIVDPALVQYPESI